MQSCPRSLPFICLFAILARVPVSGQSTGAAISDPPNDIGVAKQSVRHTGPNVAQVSQA
jgi:hypothetical protein